ncbi:MAG: hypothetical protein AAFP90_20140, partial [Planctomycetota bacterium]
MRFVFQTLALVVACQFVSLGLIESSAHAGGPLLSFPGGKTAQQKQQAIASIPFQQLNPAAVQKLRGIIDRPTIYRRLPTETVRCDPGMYVFLVRQPEILVSIWELMEITKVAAKRVGPFQISADDGAGTTCDIDLVYGDANTHIYVANGQYDGALVTSPLTGRGVFILRSEYRRLPDGSSAVTAHMDCFLQLKNLGADLVARTLSGVIGSTA